MRQRTISDIERSAAELPKLTFQVMRRTISRLAQRNGEGRSGTHLANLLGFYLAIWLMRLPFLASILFS
jgi:hypothetical protein